MREMTRPVYLVCGVPGSGKTWVCKQLTDLFHYIPHDLYYSTHVKVLVKAVREASKPVLTEVPFGERLIREELEAKGVTVIPYFVIIKPETARKQYTARENKPYPKMFFSRASTIKNRAIEWNAPHGTSPEILALLKAEATSAI